MEKEYFVFIKSYSEGTSAVFTAKNGKEAMLLAIKHGKKLYGEKFTITDLHKL